MEITKAKLDAAPSKEQRVKEQHGLFGFLFVVFVVGIGLFFVPSCFVTLNHSLSRG